MPQWTKLLKSLGFSESEAKIYLTSLELGPAPVQDIAKRAGVSRVTTYAVIESLTEKGLMSSVEKGKKRYFAAESPERLISFVQTTVKAMETTLKEIESSLDDLKLLQSGEKPVVRFFEGHEALKAIESDILETRPKQLDEFGNFDVIYKIYSHEERKEFFDQLKKIKPRNRAILLTDGSVSRPEPEWDTHDILILPENHPQFFGDIFVYGNKVALSTFRGKQRSVLIDSLELADTFRAMFEYLWHCMALIPGGPPGGKVEHQKFSKSE